MSTVRGVAVPPALAGMPLRTFRPQDAGRVYAFPRPQIARRERRRAIHRLAHGFYTVIPQEFVGRHWMPSVEAAAAGIAAARFGFAGAALMGLSAARLHGALPRAIAGALVAAEVQHRPITSTDRPAVIHFIKRDLTRLDLGLLPTELGSVPSPASSRQSSDLLGPRLRGVADGQSDESVRVCFLGATSA